MFKYRVYGLNISSEVYLPGLLKNYSKSDVVIYYDDLDHYSNFFEGKHFTVNAEGTILFWKETPLIKVSDGNQVIINPNCEVDPSILQNLLLGTALAILKHQQGFLVLHASCINMNRQAIAFLGHVGRGKSTTAFALNKKGYPIIADDVLPIKINENNPPFVFPGYPSLRLSSEVIKNGDQTIENPLKNNGKYIIKRNEGFSSNSFPLKHIYILKNGKKWDIENLSKHDALIELINNSYCLKSFNNPEKKSNLLQCANIIKNVPVKNLFVKRSLNQLPELVKHIENDAKN